jgi:hypothetical protein
LMDFSQRALWPLFPNMLSSWYLILKKFSVPQSYTELFFLVSYWFKDSSMWQRTSVNRQLSGSKRLVMLQPNCHQFSTACRPPLSSV